MPWGMAAESRSPAAQQLAVEHAGLSRREDPSPPEGLMPVRARHGGFNAMKIIYLGNPDDYDTDTARMLWRWLHATTGNRGLFVVHAQVEV